MVREASDVMDAQVWQRVLRVLNTGLVFCLRCGTLCNTFFFSMENPLSSLLWLLI